MTEITILRGKSKIVGLYRNGELVCTQDKFTTPDELETAIKAHGGVDYTVTERSSDFKTYGGLPLTLDGTETLQATMDAAKRDADKDSDRREAEKPLTATDLVEALRASTNDTAPAELELVNTTTEVIFDLEDDIEVDSSITEPEEDVGMPRDEALAPPVHDEPVDPKPVEKMEKAPKAKTKKTK